MDREIVQLPVTATLTTLFLVLFSICFSRGAIAGDYECLTRAKLAQYAVEPEAVSKLTGVTPVARHIISALPEPTAQQSTINNYSAGGDGYYTGGVMVGFFSDRTSYAAYVSRVFMQLNVSQLTEVDKVLAAMQKDPSRTVLFKVGSKNDLLQLLSTLTKDQTGRITRDDLSSLFSVSLATPQIQTLGNNTAFFMDWQASMGSTAAPAAESVESPSAATKQGAVKATYSLVEFTNALQRFDETTQKWLASELTKPQYIDALHDFVTQLSPEQADMLRTYWNNPEHQHYQSVFKDATVAQLVQLWTFLRDDGEKDPLGLQQIELLDTLPSDLAKPLLNSLSPTGLSDFVDYLADLNGGSAGTITAEQLAKMAPGKLDPDEAPDAAIRAKQETAQVTPQSPESEQAIIVNGLAQFIENRAQAEAEEYFVDSMLSKLCRGNDNILSGYFPETCAFAYQRDINTTAISGNSYSYLVTSLREDLEYVPACALLKAQNAPLGYQIASIYSQHAQGASLEELINGLAHSKSLNQEIGPDGRPDGNLLCSYANPTKAASDLNAKSPTAIGFQGPLCGVIVPIIAYAAALPALQFITRMPGEQGQAVPPDQWSIYDDKKYFKQQLFVEAFAFEFEQLASMQGIQGLQGPTDAWLNGLDETGMEAAAMQLFRYDTLREQIVQELQTLNSAGPEVHPTREQIANALLKMGNTTLEQMYGSVELLIPKKDQTVILQRMDLLSDLQGAYAAMEANEYTLALSKLEPLLDCVENPDDKVKSDYKHAQAESGYCFGGWYKSNDASSASLSKTAASLQPIAGTLMALADAKSGDQFAQTLDQLASPVDAWKLRHTGDVLAISALAGVGVDNAVYQVPKYGNIYDTSYSVFAPVGISYTWHVGDVSMVGGLLSILNVGNIIDQPNTLNFRTGKVTGNVDAKLSKVLTPGFYLVFAFWNSPWTAYVGVSHGPTDYREVNYNDGTTGIASRGTTFSIGVGLDVLIFQMH